ncbi:hypothetical protein [Streptococcus sp. sy004]|uniref:hypothetical protein n=1 Tax=Streptococcus sp. sy004 TaxID=2600149 RepID=UPI0011B444F8|nr:hypothetical protein [Streptococcus sp. sy004]TWT09769.1 hypothetical protein FRX54_06215 [Streptococcus sp. sy004]
MSDNNQLTRLQAQLSAANANPSNMTAFNDVVAVYLGVQNKAHYPKMFDSNGSKMKDESGRDKRSQNLDGYTHTFSAVGESIIVKVVLPKSYNLELMTVYKVSGLGYKISSANMIFIEKNGMISKF